MAYSCGQPSHNDQVGLRGGFPSDFTFYVSLVKCKDFDHKLSYLADSIEYIKLETNEDCLIGRFGKIIIGDKWLIGLDEMTESIFQFNLKGKFIRKIGPMGKGPGEFISVTGLAVQEEMGLLTILDDKQSKIIVMELDSGTVILEYKTSSTLLRSEYFPNTSLLCCNSPRPWFARAKTNNFIVYQDDQIINEALIPKSYDNVNVEEPLTFKRFYPYGEYLCYWDSYIDTVFAIDHNLNYQPHFIFNLGEARIPYSILSDRNKFSSPNALKYSQIYNFTETSSLLFIDMIVNKRSKRFIYTKDLNQTFFVEGGGRQTKITNDLDNGPDFWPTGITSDDREFQVVNPIELMQVTSNKEINSPKLKDLIAKTSQSDNPIIQILNKSR